VPRRTSASAAHPCATSARVPGADVAQGWAQPQRRCRAGGDPSLGADETWESQFRCRCERSGPSPGADVAGVSLSSDRALRHFCRTVRVCWSASVCFATNGYQIPAWKHAVPSAGGRPRAVLKAERGRGAEKNGKGELRQAPAYFGT
jgi:hypothetical protein